MGTLTFSVSTHYTWPHEHTKRGSHSNRTRILVKYRIIDVLKYEAGVLVKLGCRRFAQAMARGKSGDRVDVELMLSKWKSKANVLL